MILFPYHLVLLYSPPPCNHRLVVHVHESFLLLLNPSVPSTPPSTPSAVSLFSIYESVSILLVCLVYSPIHEEGVGGSGIQSLSFPECPEKSWELPTVSS